MVKADLKQYGLIGFQKYWQEKQGYLRQNLLKVIADKCFERNIEICAITSETHEEIVPGSVHDRFGFLKERYTADLEGEGYEVSKLGDNILEVGRKKEGVKKTVYLVNGQTIITKEDRSGKRMDTVIVGGNDIPNNLSLDEAIERANDKSYIQIAEVYGEHGIGEENFEEYYQFYDAISWDAQLKLSPSLANIPIVDKFTRKFDRTVNEKSKMLAEGRTIRKSRPLVAFSNAHVPDSIGAAYIDVKGIINSKNEESFMISLKDKVKRGNFEPVFGKGKISWMIPFSYWLYIKGAPDVE